MDQPPTPPEPPAGYPPPPPEGYPPPPVWYPAAGSTQPPGGYPPPGWYPTPGSAPPGWYGAGAPPPRGGGVGAVIAAVLIGCWAVAMTVGSQGIVWLIDQVMLATGNATPGWTWPVTGVANAALVALPAALLAVIPRSPAVRAAGRAWVISAVALGLLALPRGIPLAHHEAYLAVLTVLSVLGAVALRRFARTPWLRGTDPDSAPGTAPSAAVQEAAVQEAAVQEAAGREAAGRGAALALAGGLVVLMPWLWLGAAGGLTETVLAILAASGTGWLASEILGDGFWQPYQSGGTARRVLLGGLVAGVALAVLGAGIGAAGSHLAILFVLPALGFAAAALRAVGGRAAAWAIIAPAAVGPLALVDPEEVSLLLMGRDVPFWTMIATLASVGLGLLVGLTHALSARPSLTRRVAGATAVALAVAAGAVYTGLGQPGMYGDRLFVVMRDQATLSNLPAAPAGLNGHAGRTRAVYQRLVQHAGRTQADLRRELDRMNLAYTPYYLVNGLEVDGGPAVREWLSRRADVDRVLLSQRLRPLPADPGTEHGTEPAPDGPQWNITMIGADRARGELGVGGAGIVVGTSDSGVDGSHPALSDGFRGGEGSWYDPWNGTRAPRDRGGHGTHTLGSAVGDQGIGVAPDAQWIGCVNLDRNLGSPARYLDCLQFMLAPFPYGGDPFTDGRPDRAPHVLTNSWGCPQLEGCDTRALQPATAALAAAGIFFVAAAGNTGPRCDSIDDPPAPHADVLTVGAVSRDRRVTSFSSRGPTDDGRAKPELVAPGEGVLSALPGGGYGELDGTSMAAPHVAGVVALLWSANPALVGDVAQTRRLLLDTAAPITLAGQDDCGGQDLVAGAGLVDAYAAVKAARGAA